MNYVKIKRKSAIIEFVNCSENYNNNIIHELVHLVDHGFKKFIFDFSNLTETFSSTIIGFLIASIKKLAESESKIVLKNITEDDFELLKLTGIVDLEKNGNLKILYKKEDK